MKQKPQIPFTCETKIYEPNVCSAEVKLLWSQQSKQETAVWAAAPRRLQRKRLQSSMYLPHLHLLMYDCNAVSLPPSLPPSRLWPYLMSQEVVFHLPGDLWAVNGIRWQIWEAGPTLIAPSSSHRHSFCAAHVPVLQLPADSASSSTASFHGLRFMSFPNTGYQLGCTPADCADSALTGRQTGSQGRFVRGDITTTDSQHKDNISFSESSHRHLRYLRWKSFSAWKS